MHPSSTCPSSRFDSLQSTIQSSRISLPLRKSRNPFLSPPAHIPVLSSRPSLLSQPTLLAYCTQRCWRCSASARACSTRPSPWPASPLRGCIPSTHILGSRWRFGTQPRVIAPRAQLFGDTGEGKASSSKQGRLRGAAPAAAEAAEASSGWKRRWSIIAMCFVAFMLCNMDRVNMSIAILPMAETYSWTSATIGLVQSSFFWGYLLTQVLGGVWADRFGGKVVLGFGVVWWSMATMLTPLAAGLGLPALLAARACMGVGEGVAMPAMNNLLSKWVPVKERSRSLALVYSGMYTGSVLGLGVSPQMIHSLGWPSVFYIFGAVGVAWWIWWVRRAASAPADDPLISAAEERYITRNTASTAPLQSIPWRLLLSKPAVWALILSHFCHNWGTFILLTWMPTYYNQVLGLDLKSSGLFSVLPWVTMAVAANVGGWIADNLVERGWTVTSVRKIMQTIGFLGPAFFLTQLGKINTVPEAVACMMAAQGLDAFSQSGLYSNHQDIGPRYAGVLLGMSNTAGVLAGVLGTAATGLILASNILFPPLGGVRNVLVKLKSYSS